MLIESRRADDQSRLDIFDRLPQFLAECDVTSARKRCDALIGKGKKNRGSLPDAEPRQRAESLASTHGTPCRAIGLRNKEFSLEETLWPGIVFAVGDEDDRDLTAAFQDALYEAPSRDDVVVRMWRQDHRSPSRKWESVGTHDRVDETANSRE